MRYDAIVCGAGPAGAYAAYRLAREGAAVALFDRAAFPRAKPCGGAVSGKALRLVEFDLSPVVERRVHAAWLARGDEAVLREAGAVVAAMTVRAAFDQFLLARAVGAGARFFPERRFAGVEHGAGGVHVVTDRESFQGDVLLACDGAASAIRTAVFGRGAIGYASAIEATLEVRAAALARFADRVLLDLDAIAGGYGWIFGKADHLNVGVYTTATGASPPRHFERFLARHPALAGARHLSVTGYPIPVRNRLGTVERGRVWLLGDAAGVAEPILGEGIYFALKSADLAARAFAESNGRPLPGAYDALVGRELAPELGAAARLASACYAHGRLAFERIARNREAAALFLGLLTGEVGYRECLYKAVATFPAWALARRDAVVPVASI